MRLRVVLTLIACAGLSAQAARAQVSEAESKAFARRAFLEGVELQDKGMPGEALARFEAAQARFDAPTHQLHIAECQALTGKLVEASETYEELVRRSLGDRPAEAFVQAQEQGKTALVELRARIPSLRILLEPAPSKLEDLEIRINQRQMPAELVGVARPVNPGAYEISATATGFRTSTPVRVEIGEREARSVDLVLAADAATAPAAPTAAPPAYDSGRATRAAAESPSAGGLLVGLRPAVFVPTGRVSSRTRFDEIAKAGPGIGFDLIGRVARRVLVGGTFEYAALGGPDPSMLRSGGTAEVSTSTLYVGVLAGLMPNVDKVTFVGDVGAGVRLLSQDVQYTTLSAGGQSSSYSGVELALGAGLSFPAGPLRIVPKVGLTLGSFAARECSGPALSRRAIDDCNDDADATHGMLSFALGLYYHADLAKKSRSAPSAASTE